MTTEVEFLSTTKGSITVEFGGHDTLPPETLRAIEDTANGIIRDNIPIRIISKPRAEAEKFYKDHPVNHTFI